jgi:WhiB family redox-sensing transcriptional regulator
MNTLFPAPDWMSLGVCASADPDAWFPGKGEPSRPAKAICKKHCPVIDECLEWALDQREPFGVWGGHSERERRAILRRRGRAILDGVPDDELAGDDDEDETEDEDATAPATLPLAA